MRKKMDSGVGVPLTRRQWVSIAVAFGSLAASKRVWALQQAALKEPPSAPGNETRTSLHQTVRFKATAQRIYQALLGSKLFTAFSGVPAEIDPQAGGAFSMFGGMIVGRNVELVQNQRIVQAWRAGHWDSGVYSIARFELNPQGLETELVLDHTGFPEGAFDGLYAGWKAHYWERLTKFFAKPEVSK